MQSQKFRDFQEELTQLRHKILGVENVVNENKGLMNKHDAEIELLKIGIVKNEQAIIDG